jgi:hypothetical protein
MTDLIFLIALSNVCVSLALAIVVMVMVVEAIANICEVDTRTVQRFLEKAGKLVTDFHHLQLENLKKPIEEVIPSG